ncbi:MULTISPECIES: hypothetical protein [Saccharibacillus]|uniref:hypothetical protein n=1 Tax=Saccharibacillus TaxID=456492 RepID=UPI00123AC4A0|nr:hypothetical protein [Saccharibacillus sp. WB 17]MWJ33040.1 hypothetical protein [Saccharibacillus sp. WB 17]
MKPRNILLALLIVGAVAAAIGFVYGPRPVDLDVQGVKYRLGADAADEAKLVRVKIQGDVWRSWRGTPRFEGTIEVEGEVPEVPAARKKVEVGLGGSAVDRLIVYDYFDNEGLHTVTYGSLYASSDMRQVSIQVFEEGGGGQGWNSGSGLMVTAPAEKRQQALEIANLLMREELEGESLR